MMINYHKNMSTLTIKESEEVPGPIEDSMEAEDIEAKKSRPSSQDEASTSYIQWSVDGAGRYFPCYTTVKKLPEGYYEPRFSDRSGYFFQKKDVNVDNLINLPIKENQEIIQDIATFWKREKTFEKYGYIQKRGILMYGLPGCGKSSILQLVAKNLIDEHKGIVINLPDSDSVSYYIDMAPEIIRVIEPNRPMVVIIEDVDNLVQGSKGLLTKVLNILDGVNQINKVVYIGTTNYPERLEERLANRPSRFDRRYKIGLPNKNVRKYYLEHKLFKEDLKQIDMKKWLKATEHMTLAHIKELIVSVIILGNDFNESVKRLNAMKKIPHSRHDTDSDVGFKKKEY